MTTLSAYTVTRVTDTRQSEPDRGDYWREEAACREVPITGDFDPWFPEGHNPVYAHARAICQGCPVRLLCLEDAMTAERGWSKQSRHGMVGGLTPGERYKLDLDRRNRAPIDRPSPQRDRVVALTAQGMTTAEIAQEMGMSPRNVTLHRRKAREAGLLPEVAS